MKISIITPTYNSAAYIKDTLDSIHQQTYRNFEHVVIDGLSTDNTLEIVKNYDIKKVISEKDSGQSNAINKGFGLIDGDIFAWQNGDDLYTPDAFQIVTDYFTANPEVDIVYGYYQMIDEQGDWLCDVQPIEWNSWLFIHGRFCPVQPTVFWRRRVSEAVGLLDESLYFCMDVDFYAKALKQGFTYGRIPQFLGKFRVHQESKTQNKSNRQKHYNEYKKVLSTHFAFSTLDSLIFDLFQQRARITSVVKQKLSFRF
ncbi:glycosyltransferase family 2 protein [Pontibacter ramchanderi]|uniref:Glycosyltransferase involved in cell wall biosynthesis n=1 Tax=Pontibacter ramchanderi TaxID=1179743 RepID=A0A2N3U7L2_9BACT|nr:glycosyltransferase family 2 protein [Pontibacter ramchanderi]PKV62738.1 glycosyltransferase involved in cell wall biosynthesis [Pontibacter ramchanderi]